VAIASPFAALVVSSEGTAQAVQGGQPVAVHALSKLQVGDRLTVAKGGKVTLAFLQGGARVTVEGETTVAVQAAGVDGPAARVAPRAYPAGLVPSGANLDRLGGVTVRALNDPPRLTFAGTPTLDLGFLSEGVRDYQVKVEGSDNRRIVMHVPATVHKLVLDAATMRQYRERGQVQDLKAGASYTVDVTAYHATGPQSGATWTVRLADAAQKQLLTRALDAARQEVQADPTDATPFALVGSLYETAGSYADGAEALQHAAQRDPQHAAYLQEVLSGLDGDLQRVNEQAVRAHEAKAGEALP
jgi:hypothetical protein